MRITKMVEAGVLGRSPPEARWGRRCLHRGGKRPAMRQNRVKDVRERYGEWRKDMSLLQYHWGDNILLMIVSAKRFTDQYE